MLCTMSEYPGELLGHLESFCVLLRHAATHRKGTFERAAHELHVDRSVLRRRMATLEAWIGAPLVEGRGAALAPTEVGERVREAALRMLRDAEGLRTIARGAARRVRMGCTGTITTELLPPVLAELERRKPRIAVSVRRAGSALCRRWIEDGEIDVGVVRSSRAPAGLASERLCEDRLWLVLPREHTLATSRAPGIAEMARERIVLFGPASQTQDRVMETLGGHGAEVELEVDGKTSAIEYVRRGLGISFLSLLPGHRVKHPGVVLRDVSRLFGASAFWVVCGERAESAEVRELVEAMKRHARAKGRG
jgi:DNA-binding transcriptional LysR family regulator